MTSLLSLEIVWKGFNFVFSWFWHFRFSCFAIFQAVPPKKSFIRGTSYLTGYHIVSTVDNGDRPGCQVTYVTQSDPKGRFCSERMSNSSLLVFDCIICDWRKEGLFLFLTFLLFYFIHCFECWWDLVFSSSILWM